ncbi:MAG: penicillin-binding transpeptidase domain-containing protein [Gemmiger sp.]|nr:penicillin-binding transpeptidase domain-containing protein [Gemmiger sp.]
MAAFALFLGRLAYLQFYKASEYQEKAEKAASSEYSYRQAAARGDIVDANGVLLATDALCYDVYLRLPTPPGTDETEILQQILATIPTIHKNDVKGDKDVEAQLAAFSASVGAGEFLAATGLTPAQAAPLYQTLWYQNGTLRLGARGTRSWPGDAATLLPHLLGVTGPLSAAQWQAGGHALQRAGYAMDAVAGQSGLEAAFETALHGQDGRVLVTARRDGTALTETTLAAPVPGSTLRLSLDAGLQRAVALALQNQIETLRATKPAGKGREATAGAAVVVDTHTGGVLAAVSWPGYSLADYRTSYATLSADAALPLYNRVCLGLYAPGSAFKPAVAAAALAAGVISTTDTVNCAGRYYFYSGYQPGCLQLGHSGAIDLYTALKYSCNVYFYDVGRRTGADAFSAMAAQLGLGAATGVELPEAAGRLTLSTDANYQAGLVLQAAIGQGNTAVTPLQLAAYAATLANGGTRYRLHFADALLNARTGEITAQFLPEVTTRIPGGSAVFTPIQQGMEAMATTLLALRGAPVPLACKTGSPQRAERDAAGNTYTNSVLVGYAPANAPEVAVSVVIEYGGGGANAAPVLRAVLDYLYA